MMGTSPSRCFSAVNRARPGPWRLGLDWGDGLVVERGLGLGWVLLKWGGMGGGERDVSWWEGKGDSC